MVTISQEQTPVGSIQAGVPLSRVNTNPNDDDDDDDGEGRRGACLTPITQPL